MSSLWMSGKPRNKFWDDLVFICIESSLILGINNFN